MKAVMPMLLLLVANLYGQAVQTGPAKASGTCAVAHSGNYDTITIKNCGIGETQGNKIIDLLNKLIVDEDASAMNAKLDEIMKILSKSIPENNTQTCIGSACAQGPNSQATFNQLGPPPPNVTWKVGPGSKSNNVNVTISVDRAPSIPAFAAHCEEPCVSLAAFNGATGVVYVDDSRSYSTADPNIVVVLLTPHTPVGAGIPINWGIGSKSDKPVKITNIWLLSESEAATLPQPPK